MSRQAEGGAPPGGTGQQQPDVMDEDVLAIVFQQLSGKTELLSLEKLRGWEEVQVGRHFAICL